jgi:magnesium-transporting ATPase (P-type)
MELRRSKTKFYYSPYTIKLNKRSIENNTHKNIVDESINDIIPFKIKNSKFLLAILLYILTLGILYILCRIFPKFYLELNCIQCDVSQADLFLIIDSENNFHLIRALYENFYRRNGLLYYVYSFSTNNKEIKSVMEGSNYLSEDSQSPTEETLVIYFRHNKYLYNRDKKEFESVKMSFNKFSNNFIHKTFGGGLSSILDYNYLLNKFGKNIIELEGKSFFRILLGQLFHPFYLYQIYSIIVWIKTNYYSFCIVVIISAGIILTVNSLQNFNNYKRILNFTYFSPAKIIRKLSVDNESNNYDFSHKMEILNNESQYIVPGDVIELTHGEIIPCDCILLDGFCTVNEADLTGESSLVMKSPLPCDDEKFDFQNNSKSILFNGTKIDRCESLLNDGKIRALVINTGFNTQRGDLIQNILFPKPTNFKFYKDILGFLVGVMIIYIISVFLLIDLNKYKKIPRSSSRLTINILDLLTVIFPPSLPICMTFSAYYFHYSLNKRGISCISDYRMNAAGRVNIVILDKTGTLTEEGLDLHGYQTTRLKQENLRFTTGNNNQEKYMQSQVEFDEVETTAKTYNYVHQEFWKKFCKEKVMKLNNERPNEANMTKDDLNLNKEVSHSNLSPEGKREINSITLNLSPSEKKESLSLFNRELENIQENEIETFVITTKREPDIPVIDPDYLNQYSNEYDSSIEEEPSRSFIMNNTNLARSLGKSLKSIKKSFHNIGIYNNNNIMSIIPSNYQNDLKLNIIYFVECLATCHSIDKLNGNYFGNNIDRKIFDNLGWLQLRSDEEELTRIGVLKCASKKTIDQLRQSDSQYEKVKNMYVLSHLKYHMIPNKSYKIIEEALFKNINTIRADSSRFKDYRLTIVKRFEFSSKFQSMSVITYNQFDDSYRFFIKGSPESIILMCKHNSLPDNFHDKLMEHTQNGFRVLACATKVIPEGKYELETDRRKFENDLTFLGFIIFRNKLKKDTKLVISKLNQSQCKLIMATGDNPFTSISVARECEFIGKKSKVFLIDLDKDKKGLKREKLRFSYIIKKDNNVGHVTFNEEKKFKKFEYDDNIENSKEKSKNLLESRVSDKISSEKIISPITNRDKDLSEVQSNRKLLDKEVSSFSQNKSHNKSNQNNIFNSPTGIKSKNLKNNEIPNIQSFLALWQSEDFKNQETCICISGKAFRSIVDRIKDHERKLSLSRKSKLISPEENTHISESYEDLAKLIKIIELHGKIFYRMNPNDKAELVAFFKEDQSNIVAMCGDGANDCGALLCSDIGISIKHREGSHVTSHFYSSDESIACIESIIKNGRACFENSKIIFEYMLLYAIIQLTTYLVLFFSERDIANNQYLFIDLGLVLVKSIFTSKTGANMKIMKDKPNKSLLNLKFFLSIIGQAIIQVTTICVFYFVFLLNWVDDEQSSVDPALSIYNSYLFILTVFQYSTTIFSFNTFSKHKKSVFSNNTYIIYTTWIHFYIFSLLTINYFNEFANNWGLVYLVSNAQMISNSSQICKIVTILFAGGNFLITFLFEYMINKLLD